MRGHIEELARPVSGGGDDFTVPHEGSPNRNFTALAGSFGFPQRMLHGALRHLVSHGSL
jgi:hypothetical protein